MANFGAQTPTPVRAEFNQQQYQRLWERRCCPNMVFQYGTPGVYDIEHARECHRCGRIREDYAGTPPTIRPEAWVHWPKNRVEPGRLDIPAPGEVWQLSQELCGGFVRLDGEARVYQAPMVLVLGEPPDPYGVFPTGKLFTVGQLLYGQDPLPGCIQLDRHAGYWWLEPWNTYTVALQGFEYGGLEPGVNARLAPDWWETAGKFLEFEDVREGTWTHKGIMLEMALGQHAALGSWDEDTELEDILAEGWPPINEPLRLSDEV